MPNEESRYGLILLSSPTVLASGCAASAAPEPDYEDPSPMSHSAVLMSQQPQIALGQTILEAASRLS